MKFTAYVVTDDYADLGPDEHFYIVTVDVTPESARNHNYPWEVVYVVARGEYAADAQASAYVQSLGSVPTHAHAVESDSYICEHCGKIGGH